MDATALSDERSASRMAGPGPTGILSAILPTERETALLRACLLGGESGRRAWEVWWHDAHAGSRALLGDPMRPGRLLPLIHEAAQRHGAEFEPALRTLLRTARYREQLRWATYERIFLEALRALAAAGVPVIVLKGAALARAVYPDPALRHSHDIDLMVRREHLAPAASALARAGFARGRFVQASDDAMLAHPSGLPVALHVRPSGAPWPAAALAEVWARSRPLADLSAPARALSPADSLTQVCSQAALFGSRATLVWACDAWLILARERDLEWDVLVRAATASHVALPVAALLRYLATELDAAVPVEVVDALVRASEADRLGLELALAGARRGRGGAYPSLFRRCAGWHERRAVLGWMFRPSPAFIRWDCPLPAARTLPLYLVFRAMRPLVSRTLRERARGRVPRRR